MFALFRHAWQRLMLLVLLIAADCCCSLLLNVMVMIGVAAGIAAVAIVLEKPIVA